KVRLPVLAKEIERILRLARPGRNGIRIDQNCGVGLRRYPQRETDKGPCEPAVERKIREFIVDVAVANHHLSSGPAHFLQHESEADAVCQIKKQAHYGHWQRGHILIATVERLFRCSNSSIPLECLIAQVFAKAGEDNHIIPKLEGSNLQSIFGEARLQCIDLRALTSAINS